MNILESLPDTKGVVVILSGGMDSTIAMRIAVEKYGSENVKALTFNYGQKQKVEIEKARQSTSFLEVEHKIIDASFLHDISMGFSANVDPSIKMPTIREVLGDPTPKTYVPNRNMILMSIAAAYAETKGIDTILCGLQVHDEYGYWDTTQSFVDAVNNVLNQNRKVKIKIVAPFSELSKKQEIAILEELDDNIGLLLMTITCYNPNENGESCGKCPSCSERIKNMADAGFRDPISYSIDIPWEKLGV